MTNTTITESMGIVSPQTLDRLWKDRDPMARQRSSKPAFKAAVLKALSRGATIAAIETALRANDRQGDGVRGSPENYAKGVCRVLNGGHWEDFMEAEPESSEESVSVTLGQVQKALDYLRRRGARRNDQVVAFILNAGGRAVLGFSCGDDDEDVVGVPAVATPNPRQGGAVAA